MAPLRSSSINSAERPVKVDQEAELKKWLTFLNDEIATRVANAPPVDPEKQAARSFALQKAWFERIGIPLPEAGNMDELVGKIEEASKADGPLDARGKST